MSSSNTKNQGIMPIQHSVDISELSLNSQDHLESALREFVSINDKRGWCRGEPITEAGKRRQMAKMLTLILTPIIVLMAVSFYFVSENITAKLESDKIRKTVLFSVEVGKVIHAMQRERDMSVLYLSSIGPETKTFLTTRYLETDETVANLREWPTSLVNYELLQFNSKRAFQQFVTRHRNELDLLNHTLYDEITFYTTNIRVFVRWLYDSIKESKYGTIWKTLVAYQKVIEAKENVGIERALGSAYFSLGGFATQLIYEWYNEKLNAFLANIRSAGRYSEFVEPIANARISSGGTNLTYAIETFRYIIKRRQISTPSLINATLYFDNMTIYIDLVFLAQSDLALEIVNAIDNRASTVTTGVTISTIIILVVFIMCPVLVRTVRGLTNDIQNYALTLADKTKELNKEKKRTDSLLYQMLPKQVAETLKKQKDVNAEYFKAVTIFFSDIVGFTRITTECTPMQIITMLNNLYTLFDERIDRYDVYKVETIGDSYMVASGLPHRNDNKHASEIANMSLDLLASTSDLELPLIAEDRLKLRIGLHTGPCVAGVVGSQLPRYCLFGDTVNTASRMETNGVADRIHISGSTYGLLVKDNDYILQMRGPIEIKGKGSMLTYWLLGHRNIPQRSGSHVNTSVTNIQYPTIEHSSVEDNHKVMSESVTSINEHLQALQETKEAKQKAVDLEQNIINTEQKATKKDPAAKAIEKDPAAKAIEKDPAAKAISTLHEPVINTPDPPSTSQDQMKEKDISEASQNMDEEAIKSITYSQLEKEISDREKRDGSPPVFQLVEGYHF